MAKYQGAYRNEADAEENVQDSVQENQQAANVNADPDEGTFKKRYGDLRRHMQQSIQQKDAALNKMQEQLAQATRQQIKFPKTEEEVASWSQKYPDVAKIIDTIAQKRVQEALAIGEQELNKVKQLEVKSNREKAEKELRDAHPDFDKIRASKDFHDWVMEQPQYVQDALYKNNTDARAASRAIDLYKADKGIKRNRKANPQDAARSVGRTSSANAPVSGRARFTESQVQKMSPREYDANEDAILESMRNNSFVYDISGGAR
jgi:uncharacterized protein YecA (UPF0149 family)